MGSQIVSVDGSAVDNLAGLKARLADLKAAGATACEVGDQGAGSGENSAAKVR